MSESESSPPGLIDACFSRGYLLAGAAIDHLSGKGMLSRKGPQRQKEILANPELLMELSAARLLEDWLASGLCDSFPEETDAAFEALDESVAALRANPQAFAWQEELPPLTEAMFRIWQSYCAWSGLEELNADLLLQASEADEEPLLEQLAELLWEHRHC